MKWPNEGYYFIYDQSREKNYKIIKDSRIERIAKGSGNTVQSVKDFLSKFKQMEDDDWDDGNV